MRVDDPAGLLAAADRLRRLLAAPDVRIERDPIHDEAIVETFIPGREIALDGILTDGSLMLLALFDKPDPLDGPFFEETIYVAPSRESPAMQQAIVAHVMRAADAIGLRHGPIHAECRIAGDRVFVLEVAARPIGGLCSKAVALAGADGEAVTLEDVVLRHAIGEDVSSYRPAAGASGVMMIPIPQAGVFRGAEGVDEARATPGVSDIRMTATPDARVVPLPEARSYLGFIFASGATPAGVESALRTAHGRLRVRIDRDVPVLS
jgi:biotin carboxylase